MAFQLASAFVELSARGVNTVTGQINSVGQKLMGLTSYAGAAVTALGGIAGIAGAGGLIKLAADAESVATQLRVLTGDAEKAKTLVADLKAFGAATPFEFPGLAETAKTLLAFQVSQQQIIPTMQVLGDIAAATGKPLQEMAQIYGKIKSQGKLTAETLDQLQERSVPVVATLAKQFGVAETAIRDMVSEGKVSFGNLQQALSTMTAEGGMFAGGMAQQSKTLSGLWSTFTDEFTSLLTEIGGAIVEGFDLKGVVTDMTSFVSTLKGSIIPTIREWIASTVSFVTENKEMILSLLQAGAIVGGVILTVTALSSIITGLGIAFAALTSPIGLVAVALGGLAIAFPEFFSSILGDLWTLVENWDIAGQLIYQHFILSLSNMWERIKAWGMNVVELVTWVGENWYQIIESYINFQITIYKNLWENIKSGWQAILDFFSGKPVEFNWTPLTEGFKSTIKALPEFTRAAVKDTNAEIEKLNEQLNRRVADKNKSTTNAAKSDATSSSGKLDIDKTAAPGAKKDKKENKFEFVGIAQLAEKMQQEASNKADEKRKEQLAERQANAAEKLAQKAEGDGLKVTVTNMGGRPGSLNPAFG